MEQVEEVAHRTAENPPKFWKSILDDTFIIQHTKHKKDFLYCINNTDQAIKFTGEDTRTDGSIPLLGTLVAIEQNKTLFIHVYRRPTHMDQYLHWISHYNKVAKYIVINTLVHRAKVVCYTPELLLTEQQHLREVLAKCK